MAPDITNLDRNFRYGLLGIAVLTGALDTWTGGDNPWFRSAFVITMAGMVGYFTNFLAIKMLFQPKHGQVLGWRGLVPKNQHQIAQSLGASVQEQLLSPDIILAYIRERALIESATQSLAGWIDHSLQDPDVRRRITRQLIEFAHARAPELLSAGFDISEKALKAMAHDPALIERYWQRLRAMMVEFADSATNRQKVAERAQALVLENLPRIASWLDDALEDYLRTKKAMGSVGLGLKSLISLDREAIRDLLRRFAEDPQVAEQFMQSLDAAFNGLQRELEAEQTQSLIQNRLAEWIETLAELARKHMLPASIEQLEDYLSDASNWAAIEKGLISGLSWGKDKALSFLASPRGHNWLRSLLERAVQRLNVTELVEEQVMKLDTDELEAMVLDNTGGNLTIIQVLGGILGIIAGTVQVHVVFALPLLAGLLVVFLAWRFNEWQQRRLKARQAH